MTKTTGESHKVNESLKQRAQALKLYGLLAHWSEVDSPDWVEPLIHWEETERVCRGLERRIKAAHLGRFKPLADFDWQWPSQCDKQAVSELMMLDFMADTANVILVGPNGVGKSMIACNIAHQAALAGHAVRFINAAQMLNELAAQDGDMALKRRLALYARPSLLVIDEIGYLSYSNRHADLLFEIINRRYELKSTIITTNRPFSEWNEVFPNAACVVSIIDRLVHHAEIIQIDGESFRLKEAKEQAQKRQQQRAQKQARTKATNKRK